MHYFSTNRISPHVSFRNAVLGGQPGDKGLYFPSEIPKLAPEFINNLENLSNEQIAFDVIRPYVGGEIPVDTPFGKPSDAFIVGELDGVTVAFLPRSTLAAR